MVFFFGGKSKITRMILFIGKVAEYSFNCLVKIPNLPSNYQTEFGMEEYYWYLIKYPGILTVNQKCHWV